jgi:hypothetical protein
MLGRFTRICSTTNFILAVSILLFAFGCKRRSGVDVITDFGDGVRYEKWADVSDGPRVLVKAGGSEPNSGSIVIPGDIVWCQNRSRFIFGEKAPSVRPAAWMSPDWDRSGFFLVDSSAIDLAASSDEARYGKAVRWFDSKESLEQALKTIE